MSEFVIAAKSNEQNYCGPDFKMYSEKWWDDPAIPQIHPRLDAASSFLQQVDEEGQGEKQSCFLTSQLNALIARRSISVTEAARIQENLSTDERHLGYWIPYGQQGQVGWAPNPLHLAFVLNKYFSIRTGVESADSQDAVTHMTERLRAGYAVILLGTSAVGGHARLAFEPQESPGELFIHDPKYAETTGFYAYEQLQDFHVQNRVVVY